MPRRSLLMHTQHHALLPLPTISLCQIHLPVPCSSHLILWRPRLAITVLSWRLLLNISHRQPNSNDSDEIPVLHWLF